MNRRDRAPRIPVERVRRRRARRQEERGSLRADPSAVRDESRVRRVEVAVPGALVHPPESPHRVHVQVGRGEEGGGEVREVVRGSRARSRRTRSRGGIDDIIRGVDDIVRGVDDIVRVDDDIVRVR